MAENPDQCTIVLTLCGVTYRNVAYQWIKNGQITECAIYSVLWTIKRDTDVHTDSDFSLTTCCASNMIMIC